MRCSSLPCRGDVRTVNSCQWTPTRWRPDSSRLSTTYVRRRWTEDSVWRWPRTAAADCVTRTHTAQSIYQSSDQSIGTIDQYIPFSLFFPHHFAISWLLRVFQMRGHHVFQRCVVIDGLFVCFLFLLLFVFVFLIFCMYFLVIVWLHMLFMWCFRLSSTNKCLVTYILIYQMRFRWMQALECVP